MKTIYTFSLVSALAICAFGSISAQTSENGKLISRSPYKRAPFDAVKGLEKVVSREEYETAFRDDRFEMETVKYSSDGIIVSAFLFGPKVKTGKLPVIVFNRGGYIRGDIGHEILPFAYRFAKIGFIVIAPMYRGSDGAAGKDEVGGGDVDDLMNVVPLLQTVPEADTKNLFLYGESRGGMMVFQALRDGFPANAAATFGGFSDFNMLISSDPKLYEPLIKMIWPDFEAKKSEIVNRRSAVRWADKINTPIFLMHGGADRSVDPQQTLNLATQLQKLGKNYELLIYNGDDHTLSHNQVDRDSRVAIWFKKFIKKMKTHVTNH